ncbi:hypothetical protein M3Y99_01930900 [Aphelenchoides fujianensis]|nr:hypothetical protein M3Y99_01930900 [Aphelenchoides fujianensis]
MRQWIPPLLPLVLLAGVLAGRSAVFDSDRRVFTVSNSLLLQLDVGRSEREFELLADFGGCAFRLLVGPSAGDEWNKTTRVEQAGNGEWPPSSRRSLPSARFSPRPPRFACSGPTIVVNFRRNSFRFTADRTAAESFRCAPTITRTPDGFRPARRSARRRAARRLRRVRGECGRLSRARAWTLWKVVLLLVFLAASIGSTVWCVWWVYRLFKSVPMV